MAIGDRRGDRFCPPKRICAFDEPNAAEIDCDRFGLCKRNRSPQNAAAIGFANRSPPRSRSPPIATDPRGVWFGSWPSKTDRGCVWFGSNYGKSYLNFVCKISMNPSKFPYEIRTFSCVSRTELRASILNLRPSDSRTVRISYKNFDLVMEIS